MFQGPRFPVENLVSLSRHKADASVPPAGEVPPLPGFPFVNFTVYLSAFLQTLQPLCTAHP